MSKHSDCIFCKMASGELKVPKVYEDEHYFCIRDIQPQAQVHLLVIPKVHVASLDTAFFDNHPNHNANQSSRELLGGLFDVATAVARKEGLLPSGFRSVINTNANGGQTVFHLHLHLIGGEPLRGTFA